MVIVPTSSALTGVHKNLSVCLYNQVFMKSDSFKFKINKLDLITLSSLPYAFFLPLSGLCIGHHGLSSTLVTEKDILYGQDKKLSRLSLLIKQGNESAKFATLDKRFRSQLEMLHG